MKIAGTVIWYNPGEEHVENIKSYIDYIDELYIIDNSDKDNKLLAERLNDPKIKYFFNGRNLGIAKALNLGCEKAFRNDYTWILTMDQDSSFPCEKIKNYFEDFDAIQNNSIGIISPYHVLKNDIIKTDEKESFTEIDNVMTSGNLLNLRIWEKVGKFDESLFIDEVDSDICYKIIEKGYKIIQLNKIKMFHELGKLEKRNFFMKKISVFNHNYIRKYYIIRNKCYMWKKYKKYRKRYSYYILNDFFKVIFYEKDKLRKLKYMFRGIKDFFKNKMGEVN